MIVGVPTKLNLIPSGVMPVVYINQGDAGYDKEFLIYNGDTPYNVPSGVSATIRGTKADNYGVTEAAAVTTGSNLVTVTITEQMVAAEGANLYELVFVDTDGLRIATINMVWAVKKDALGDSVISDSDLDYATQVLNRLQSIVAFKNQLDTNTNGLAAETAARIANDNAETAARASADSQLQANINAETSARSVADNVLQTEIDQLVAPTGAAPSAAEVENARIGANGASYSSLGDAIRGQIANLTNYADGIEKLSTIKITPVFVQGKNINSSGQFVNNSKRIATQAFIDISSANTSNDIPMNDKAYSEGISYSIADGYRMYVAYYSEASESAHVSDQGWLTGDGTLTPAGNFMRLGYATVDDATTMTVDQAGNILLSLNYTLKTVVEKLNNWGLTLKGSMGQNSDADTFTTVGMYVRSTDRTVSNLPTISSGTLVVIPSNVTESTSPKRIMALTQIYIAADTMKIWGRYSRYENGGHVWRDWLAVNPDTSSYTAIVERTKWLAVGDSITYGVYSYIGSGGTAGSAVTTDCWVRLLATAFNYDLTVMASRGMGYTVTGQDPDDSSLPRITLDTLLSRIEALTDDFNLITLAFGINDYATAASTISAIETSFNSAVERLLIKFPSARLVVITPFNSCRAGTAASNWAYNTETGDKTLKDVADAIKARCVAYGIECIDASNGFLFNTFNIQGLQPDNTHPSLTGHKLIAKNMAHYLLY